MTIIQDLLITECPIQCGSLCERIWVNQDKSHSIRCICSCHNKEEQSSIILDKEKASELVVGPASSDAQCNGHLFSRVNTIPGQELS
jgi:hypothetical protein